MRGAPESKPIIYQLFPRQFGNYSTQGVTGGTIEENGCGKFNSISDRVLQELKNFGITHLWLTGVIHHAKTTDYQRFGISSNHPCVVKGRAGSPYAIRDYYDVDPDLAVSVPDRIEEFRQLIERIHLLGLKLLIDFVPNHVAREYCSVCRPAGTSDLGEMDDTGLAFHPNNNFYYLPGEILTLKFPPCEESDPYLEQPARVTGNDQFHAQPGLNDWYDTIKLNYGFDYLNQQKHFVPVPDTWEKMVDILKYWTSFGIDGFRCDMAGMVPLEFWSYAIHEVHCQYPDTDFLAEIYEPHRYRDFLEQGQFRWLYDKCGFYDALRMVIQHNHHTGILSDVWKSLEGLDDNMLRFIENHDEQRVASLQFCGWPDPGVPAFALCAFMHRGPVMIYNGQELGERAAHLEGYGGGDGRTSIYDYGRMPEIHKWLNGGIADGTLLSGHRKQIRLAYQRILSNLKEYPVLSRGYFYDLMWGNEDAPGRNGIYAFLRYHGEEVGDTRIAILVIINFLGQPIDTFIRIPSHALDLMEFKEVSRINVRKVFPDLENTDVLLPDQISTRGIRLTLEPLQYQLFEIFC